jgi:holo-[acyl-carrier protein] synthase
MVNGGWHMNHDPSSISASILGTGVDIVETVRIQSSVEEFGDRFLNRCFWPDEAAYCRGMKFPALHFAARFAAKEAISKAFGTGIGQHLGWKDMEIRKRDSGEPYVVFHGKGAELAKSRGVTEVFVSLSHCKDYAAAHAVLVGQARPSARPGQ